MAAAVRIDFTVGGVDVVQRAVTSILQSTEKAARQEVKTAADTAAKTGKIKKKGAEKTAEELDKLDAASKAKQAARDRRDQERRGAAMAADIRVRNQHEKQKEALETGATRRRQSAQGSAMSKDINDVQRNARRKQEILGSAMSKDLAATKRSERQKQEALGAAMAKDLAATKRVERQKQETLGAAMAQDVATAQRSARRKQEILGAAMSQDLAATKRVERQKQEALGATMARDERRSRAASVRKAEREAKASTSATRGFFTDVGGGAARGLRSGAGVVAAGGGLLAGAVGTQGILSAVESSMSLETQAAQLAADVRTGDGGFLDRGALVSDSQRVAKATGIKSEAVMGAMGIAASEGGGAEGLQAFRGALDDIGTIALASGTKIEDLASVSATMSNNLITSSKDQVRLMLAINAAAKTGNVGFRAMASNVMEVAGMHQAMSFSGTAERRIELSSGMIQMAKQGGAGSAAEAATSARSFMADLVGDKGKALLASKGIKAYTKDAKGNKVARDVEDLTVDMFKASKGDPEKLSKVFDIRSKMTQSAIAAAYKKDGEKGIRSLFKEFTGAQQSGQQVGQEADLQKGTTANKVARSMEDFKAKVGGELLPVLDEAIPHFAKLAKVVATLVQEFAASPGKVVAQFLALSTLLGTAQAALGNVVGRLGSTLLDKLMGTKVMTMNVHAGVVNTSGAPGVGGVAGGLGSTAAGFNATTGMAAATAGVGGYMIGQAIASATDKDIEGANKTRQDAGVRGISLANELRYDQSPEKRAEGQKLLASLKAEQSKGALSRLTDGALAGGKGLLAGDLSAGNIASLIPQIAAVRGIGNAVLGGKVASEEKTAGMAIADLEAALAKGNAPAVAATEANTAAIVALPQQIAAAANLQGPKAPAP